MNDFAFITQLKDEPLALLVLGAMIVYRAFEALIKHIIPVITKKKKIPIEEWQEFVSENIGEIKTNVDKLFSMVSVHEQFTSKISEGTLVNQLFSDEIWPFLRLKAFRRLLAMGKNGRIWECGYNLILQHKETWRDVLDTELGIEILDKEFYQARLAEINRRIFDGFM